MKLSEQKLNLLYEELDQADGLRKTAHSSSVHKLQEPQLYQPAIDFWNPHENLSSSITAFVNNAFSKGVKILLVDIHDARYAPIKYPFKSINIDSIAFLSMSNEPAVLKLDPNKIAAYSPREKLQFVEKWRHTHDCCDLWVVINQSLNSKSGALVWEVPSDPQVLLTHFAELKKSRDLMRQTKLFTFGEKASAEKHSKVCEKFLMLKTTPINGKWLIEAVRKKQSLGTLENVFRSLVITKL